MRRLIQSSRQHTGHLLLRTLLIAVSVSTLTNLVRADGGVVLWQRTAGPFTVTVFSAETPLRTGPADISVLLESAGGHRPLMDAQVFIELQHEAGMTVNSEATHTQARNKLLYCSLVNLPATGHWKMRLIVKRGGERAEALGDFTVAGSQTMLLSYWKLLSLPPVVMILFIINQWLRRSRRELN